jgi:hypothetical protein
MWDVKMVRMRFAKAIMVTITETLLVTCLEPK